MSANQIPHFGPKYDDMPGQPREHSCPTCWKNGGPGHHLDHLIEQQVVLRARAQLEPPAITDRSVIEYLTTNPFTEMESA
ncbi:hypothetical protein [Nonomuraea sp. NPDC002799]